jgi:hypothetical protein
MILVTRYVAEAIAENVNDDDIVSDNDESIELTAVPNELDLEFIESYVLHQRGNSLDAKSDMEASFKGQDMASSVATTFYWERN